MFLFLDMTHLDAVDGLDPDNSDSGVSTPDPAAKPKKVIYEVIVWCHVTKCCDHVTWLFTNNLAVVTSCQQQHIIYARYYRNYVT